MAGKPDLIVVSGYVPDTTIILREAFEAGNTVPIIIPGWAWGPGGAEGRRAGGAGGAYRVRLRARQRGCRLQECSTPDIGAAMGGPGVGERLCGDVPMTWRSCSRWRCRKAGPGADNAAVSKAVLEIAGPPGQKVTSFAEGKAALKAGQKINYEGASGSARLRREWRRDFGVRGEQGSRRGRSERLYLLK